MPLTTKTVQEIEQVVRAIIRNLIPGADVSALSDYDITARIAGAVFSGNQEQALFLLNQIFPSKAEEAYLLIHADVRNIERFAPTANRSTFLLTAEAVGITQPNASTITHADGTIYILDGAYTSFLPAWTGKTTGAGSSVDRLVVLPHTTDMAINDVLTVGGAKRAIKHIYTAAHVVELYHPLPVAPSPGTAITATIGVVGAATAQDPGAQANKPIGDVATLDEPEELGSDSFFAEVMFLESGGGGDLEDVEELRARVIAHDAFRPGAGNPEDYRSWARATPTIRIANAFVYPNARGHGTIDIVPYGLSGTRITPSSINSLIDAYVRTQMPFDDDLLIVPLTYDSPVVDFALAVFTEVGFEPDWSGSLSSSGSGGTTTVLTVGNNPTLFLEIGDRVVFSTGIGIVPSYIDVHTVVGLTATTVTIDPPLPFAPVSPPYSYNLSPAGPNTQAVLNAIKGCFDELGPGVDDGVGGTFVRHPDPSIEHPCVLKRSRIVQAVMNVEGVSNVNHTLVADVEPGAMQILRLGELVFTHS